MLGVPFKQVDIFLEQKLHHLMLWLLAGEVQRSVPCFFVLQIYI
jgi:hypothetical protein